jgi:hypothetical protein
MKRCLLPLRVLFVFQLLLCAFSFQLFGPNYGVLPTLSRFFLPNAVHQQQQNRAAERYRSTLITFMANIIDVDSSDAKEVVVMSLKEEIAEIVDVLFQASMQNPDQMYVVPPQVLIDFSHILTQGYLYEEVMQEKIESCAASADIEVLENIDGQMKGFIVGERRARTRLKLNYILGWWV